jgi:hypothetical protein
LARSGNVCVSGVGSKSGVIESGIGEPGIGKPWVSLLRADVSLVDMPRVRVSRVGISRVNMARVRVSRVGISRVSPSWVGVSPVSLAWVSLAPESLPWVGVWRVCVARVGVTRIGVSSIGLARVGCLPWVGRASWWRGWSRPVARIREPRLTGSGRRGRSEPGVGAGMRVDGRPVHTPAPVRGARLARRQPRIPSSPGIWVLVIRVLVIGVLVITGLRVAVR